jgi:hypothetical protein
MLMQWKPIVMPTRLDFLLLLAVIGLLGFVAQVRYTSKLIIQDRALTAWHQDPSDHGTATWDGRPRIYGHISSSTMGLTPSISMLIWLNIADHICHDSWTYVPPLCALHTFNCRKCYHPYICDLCCCKPWIVISGTNKMADGFPAGEKGCSGDTPK